MKIKVMRRKKRVSYRLPHPTIAQRFARQVDAKPGQCWIWTGAKAQGYGVLGKGSHELVRAHRFSYEFFRGPILNGLHVCHKCDNPPCVNPAHLFLGTPMDNATDKIRKGRARSLYGTEAPSAKLTESAVQEITAARRAGESCRSIALRYGVSHTAVLHAAKRVCWKHVENK